MNIKAITKDREQQYREDLERLKRLRPLDDDFLRELLRNDLPLAQEILRIIMQKDDLVLIEVHTQYDMKRASGARGLCLDARAVDSQDQLYDLEVQRKDDGADPHRARFHSSAMDFDNLHRGQSFDKLPNTYVIFITEHDFFGEGAAFYPIERINLVTGKPFGDGEHILYVNGAYEGDSEIGQLLHDFRCSDPDDMYNKKLAEKSRYLKENPEGVRQMCKILEDMVKETEKRDALIFAYNLLVRGKETFAEIAEDSGLTIEEVQELARDNDLMPV